MADLSFTFDRLKNFVSTLWRGAQSQSKDPHSCAEDTRTRADRSDDIFRSLTFPRLDGEKKRQSANCTPGTDDR